MSIELENRLKELKSLKQHIESQSLHWYQQSLLCQGQINEIQHQIEINKNKITAGELDGEAYYQTKRQVTC